jgi:hypothetical protein
MQVYKCAHVCVRGFVSAQVCGCMQVYVYRIDRLKICALLNQQSHRVHLPVAARVNQRCLAVLPSQPASVRTSGAAAATQARVQVWVHERVPVQYV